jgi:heat shock protein HslJ
MHALPRLRRGRWLGCLFLMTACGGADNSAPAGSTTSPASDASTPTAAAASGDSHTPVPALERTRWSLVASGLASAAPEQADRVRLEFKEVRLSADSGCNLGVGAYRLEGNALVIDRMATTRRACPGASGAYESAFFGFLGARPGAKLESAGDELVLEAPGSTLRFRSEPMPRADAVQKFIHVAAERVPCRGVAASTADCLQVRDSPDEPWRAFHGEIIGFTPEPGVEYRLRVLEDPVPNPPADAAARRWYLDLVVDRRVVTP